MRLYRILPLVLTASLVAFCTEQTGVMLVDGQLLPDERADQSAVLDLDLAAFEEPRYLAEEAMPDIFRSDFFGDVPVGESLAPLPGTPGAPCTDGNDCDSGYCIHTPSGKQCTMTCVEDCPFGWVCVQHQLSLPDEVLICSPPAMNLCKPCNKNTDCLTNGVQLGDVCIPYGNEGNFCGARCMGPSDCPAEYQCKKVLDVWGYESSQCVLSAGVCGCQPWFVDEGASTSCAKANEYGLCKGKRECTPEGLTPCDAVEPTQEKCNGQDDDCDGQVDEGAGGGPCFIENDWGSCLGTYKCTAGELVCSAQEPGPETCDGKDNDCDGVVDEGFPDSDNDGVADCLENDKDGDGVNDINDNCPYVPNPGQEDFDLDTKGDACDPDDDNDLTKDELDCDPFEPKVNPQAEEKCNGKDDNCNSLVDEGFPDSDGDKLADCMDPDNDNDGFEDKLDCAPTDSSIHPGADETCNSKDDDCDGLTDELFPDEDGDKIADCVDSDLDEDGVPNEKDNCPKFPNKGQQDQDGDGMGDPCDPDLDGDGIPNGSDTCPAIPNAAQKDLDEDGKGDVCDPDVDGDGVPNNADLCPVVPNPEQHDSDEDGIGDACDDDSDGDGDPDATDCSPLNPYVHSGAKETCDGLDNNCNGLIDEGFLDTDLDGLKDCVDPDDDNDGVSDPQDCAPLDPKVFPGAAEVCNGLDDDCSGLADDGLGTISCGKGECFHTVPACSGGKPSWCDPMQGATIEVCDGKDNDCDGLTDEDLGFETCGVGICFHMSPKCKDGKENPCDPFEGAQPETCDGKDNDCNGIVDQPDSLGCKEYFYDGDHDGFGTQDKLCLCAPTPTYSALVSDDCNDANPWIFPGATEMCDGKDNNCNGKTDEEGAVGCSWFFKDSDADGYGSGDPQCVCTSPGAGWSVLAGDCNDEESEIHPGALELCDQKDNDCNGEIDENFDLATDPKNCGACGFSCQPDNAIGKCVDKKCVIASCIVGFADCNNDPKDGCEKEIFSDVLNCGGCSLVCDLDNAVPACLAGKCVILECNMYFLDADDDPDNGCEKLAYGTPDFPATTCKEIHTVAPSAPSGWYFVKPLPNEPAFDIYCDMTTDAGGWTLVWSNRRETKNKPTTSMTWNKAINTTTLVNGNKTADPHDFDCFVGLKFWNSLGTTFRYDWSNDSGPIDQRFYASFSLDPSANYTLHLSSYQQKIGTTTAGIYSYHNNTPFSTYDNDHSLYSCGSRYSNTPFWYVGCWDGSINGGGEYNGEGFYNGAYWSGSPQSWGKDDGYGAGNGWFYLR